MMKQVLKHKLKGLPEAQRNMIIGAVERDPDFFKKIGNEIEKRKKSGMPASIVRFILATLCVFMSTYINSQYPAE